MARRERGLFGTYSVDDAVLSKGGVGSIHRTSNPSLVYKRYFSPQKAPRREHLDRLIQVGREVLIRQDNRLGDSPESSVNWPIDIVVGNNGLVNGVVLPTIPTALFSPDLKTVRTLDFLVMARANPPSAKGRVVVLLRMAEILAFVNARGLVHGDLNSKNLAWTLHPNPVTYLIDCDGMLPQAPPPRTGVGAPGWMDPRVVDRMVPAHDHYSDWYCLALAMYRGLLLTPGRLDKTSDGHWPGPSKIPPQLHPEVAHLIRRGLSNPLASPHQRPTPQEWVNALLRAYLPNGSYDEDALTTLDTLSTPKPTPPTNFVPVPPVKPPSTSPPRSRGPRPPTPPPQPTRQRPPSSHPPPPGPRQPAAPQHSPRYWLLLVALIVIVGTVIVARNGTSPAGGNPIVGGSTAQVPSTSQDNQPPEVQLQQQRDEDSGRVERLVEYWVPQLSAKKPGLSVHGRVFSISDVLADHESLRSRYPEALLLWSADYSTYNHKDFWITVLDRRYSSAAEANAWCDSAGILPEDCFAKLLSHSRDPQGSTEYR